MCYSYICFFLTCMYRMRPGSVHTLSQHPCPPSTSLASPPAGPTSHGTRCDRCSHAVSGVNKLRYIPPSCSCGCFCILSAVRCTAELVRRNCICAHTDFRRIIAASVHGTTSGFTGTLFARATGYAHRSAQMWLFGALSGRPERARGVEVLLM